MSVCLYPRMSSRALVNITHTIFTPVCYLESVGDLALTVSNDFTSFSLETAH